MGQKFKINSSIFEIKPNSEFISIKTEGLSKLDNKE